LHDALPILLEHIYCDSVLRDNMEQLAAGHDGIVRGSSADLADLQSESSGVSWDIYTKGMTPCG
jgi:hypothetical protein